MNPSISAFLAGLLIGILLATTPGLWADAPYRRADWRHWTRASGCRDTRQTALVRDAVPGSLTYYDARECQVTAGAWVDPYTGQAVTDPARLDVDHLVPLKHAHEAGGALWDAERKRAYANFLGYRGHLWTVSRAANRQKGDQGPDRWRPPAEASWCRYAEAWATVVVIWALEVGDAERAAVRAMAARC